MFTTSDGETHDRNWYLNVYLYSEHWHILRGAKLRRNPLCEECGTHKKLQVHHLNYRRIYDVILEDLKTLCDDCHSEEHKLVKHTNAKPRSKNQIRKELRRLKRIKKRFKKHHGYNPPKTFAPKYIHNIKSVSGLRLKRLSNEQELIEQTRINSAKHKELYKFHAKDSIINKPINNKSPDERYNKRAFDLFRTI